jgi:hypothetical protein
MLRGQHTNTTGSDGLRKILPAAIVLAVLLCEPAFAEAPGFATPVHSLSTEFTLFARDGRELEGRIRRFGGDPLWGMGEINPGVGRIQFQTADGEREWFEANEIERLRAKLDWIHRSHILDEHTSSIKSFVEALKNDFSEVVDREFTYYEPVETKPGKSQIYELVNPGFDSRIKVFFMAEMTFFAPEDGYGGGVTLDGVEVTSPQVVKWLVVKDGAMGFVVKKGKYKKKHFDELFGDCDAMQKFAEDDRKYKYFAEHVFVYDQLCH